MLEEVESWLLKLDADTYDQVAAAIDKLAQDGSTLGRPLVDRINGSAVHNRRSCVLVRQGPAKCGGDGAGAR
ncbi:MAG TPA: hypothetical protein VD813_15930 [Pseudonocardia sp.]|nr:hypothetical protein [Pseudonocardia sp.]